MKTFVRIWLTICLLVMLFQLALIIGYSIDNEAIILGRRISFKAPLKFYMGSVLNLILVAFSSGFLWYMSKDLD